MISPRPQVTRTCIYGVKQYGFCLWASVITQLVKKICLQCRRPQFDSWVRKIFTMFGPLSYMIPCSLWVEWQFTLVCPGPVPAYTCVHGVIRNSLFSLSKVSQLEWYIVQLLYQGHIAIGDNQVRGVHSLVPLCSSKCNITYMLSPLINRLNLALSSC